MATENWCKFSATLYATILTIFTISNSVLKTARDKLSHMGFIEITALTAVGAVFFVGRGLAPAVDGQRTPVPAINTPSRFKL